MGFLNGSGGGSGSKTPDWQLAIGEVTLMVRPLAPAPEQIWGHGIPSVSGTGPDGKPFTIRKYSFEICTSTSRSGTGCQGCTSRDPLWHLLTPREQTNKHGQRVDFPKKPIFIMPVLVVSTGEIKVMKGGNGTFKDMDDWYDIQGDGLKDLRRCEWGVFKRGVGLLTSYKAVRSNDSPFNLPVGMAEAAQNQLVKARSELAPMAPQQFLDFVKGSGVLTPSQPVQAETVPVTAQQTFIAPTQQSTVVYPTVVTAPTITVSPPAVAVPVPTVTVQTPAPQVAPPAPSNVLPEFIKWLNDQPEFQGLGILNNLVPVLKQDINGVDYYKCSPDELANLKSVLTNHLASMRGK